VSGSANPRFAFEFNGQTHVQNWKTTKEGLQRLAKANRLIVVGNVLSYVRYLDDFPVFPITNIWTDTGISGFAANKMYVVQTNTKVIARCIMMTTDPGDLVLDPTCGSGTTAFVAEEWGRRWITCDTSRVSLSIARQRLMTAKFDYYKVTDSEKGVDGGLVYESIKRITLGTFAQDEPPKSEVLYDKPIVEPNSVRMSGPFTVEAIPAPVVQEQSVKPDQSMTVVGSYIDVTIDLLQKTGVTFPGGKQMAIENLRRTASAGFVHAEGEAKQNGDKMRVAVSLGPRYGPITAKQVDEAIRSAYKMGFDMLIFAGFAFDTEAQATIHKNPIPRLAVQMVHISPDVIVGAYCDSPLLKTTKSSQLFTVFGEPDVKLESKKDEFQVKLLGVDLYDPTTGEVHSSNAGDVPAWFLDEDYDGYTFRICQAFFPKEATAKNPWDKLENALRGVVDSGKMEMFRGTQSLLFKAGEQKQIAVKVIDIRGNEVMVVKSLNAKETT
jgi:adenine-specific DNA-methyltransferase